VTRPAYITRLSAFLPNRPVENDEMERVLGQTGERPSRARRVVLRNNGIRQRHYVIDPDTGVVRYNNAQLTAAAVRALCSDGYTLDRIQCIAVGTSLADQLMPSHGVMVHGELGNPACEVVTTSGVCVAGVLALKYAWLAIKSGECDHAVAAGSEVASLAMRSQRFAAEKDNAAGAIEARPELAFEKDFLRWMLSDAAGAMALAPEPRRDASSLRIDWIDVFSHAHEMPACMYAGADRAADGRLTGWMQFDHAALGEHSVFAVKQDVRLLNDHIALYCAEKPFAAVMQKRGLRAAEVDWFLPHLSSFFFEPKLAAVLEKIGLPIPRSRWFTNLATRGNTGSASIYLMLEELIASGRAEPGQRIVCVVPESGRFSTAIMHLTVVR